MQESGWLSILDGNRNLRMNWGQSSKYNIETLALMSNENAETEGVSGHAKQFPAG